MEGMAPHTEGVGSGSPQEPLICKVETMGASLQGYQGLGGYRTCALWGRTAGREEGTCKGQGPGH